MWIKLFEEFNRFFIEGNNEVLVFFVLLVFCIGPLLLMWRSTYVVDRPYSQYATSPLGVPVTELDINLASSAERNVSPSMQQTPIPSGVSINPENVGGVDEPLDQNSSIPSNQENAADPLDQNSSIPSNQENAAEANRPINQETISETSQIPNQASITTTNNDDVVDPDVSISGLQSEATTDRNVDNIPSENNVEEPSTSQPNATSIPDLLPDHFYIRLKYLDETVQVVQAKPSDTVGEFRRKNFSSSLIDRYRLIYKGNVLRNNEQTLQDCGVMPIRGSSTALQMPVIHCILAPASATNTEAGNFNAHPSVDDLNVGNYFLPILGIFLSMLWYLCIYHTNLFTIPSVFGIIGLTCFFIVLVVNRFL